MAEPLYQQNAYLREAEATVIGYSDEGGILVDAALFYPTGGGQPGDNGRLIWEGGDCGIATAVKDRETGAVVLVPDAPQAQPPIGCRVSQILDWERRYAHMRMHTALHLLSVVIPLPVTGGAVGADKGRLDFAMEDAPEDKAALEQALNALVDRDLPVTEDWISDAELAANPDLVKTMSVAPPMGTGRVRLIRIGAGDTQVDLQPCGGTHVARTGEIGPLRLGKIEKKGRLNRRVAVHFA